MKFFPYRVAGDETLTRVPETPEDFDEFRRWVSGVSAFGQPIGLDTETTGLDVFSPNYRLRTVQFGTGREAWVLQVEKSRACLEHARWALRSIPRFLIHNAAFDWLVLDRHARVPLEELYPKTIDTRLLAHLHDGRLEAEGGTGLGLKPLSALFVDPDAPDTAKGLYAEFHKIGKTKETGWAAIDVDNPLYLQYAGLDVLLVSRLYPVLRGLLTKFSVPWRLAEFEHKVSYICSKMERKGMRLDVDYTRALAVRLAEESDHFAGVAQRYGVESLNSTTQVADALAGMGETLTERTPSGKVKVDKAVLLALADLDGKWKRIGARTPNPLADAVIRSKRAGKWKTAYADNMLSGRDADDRIHPKINSLQARTGRMSITNPALQTLPSGDWTIRRAMLADEGKRIISVDYSAVEMRVLAALAPEPRMIEAIAAGRDLHDFTASLVFGKGFTADDRKVAKAIGFGKVYGGGATTIQRQTGAPMPAVQTALAAYNRVYRGITRFSKALQSESRANGYVVRTPSGRRLPLDRDRVYASTNYLVQSSARDVLCQALVDLDERGLSGALLLPVHDEVVAQADAREAPMVAREIAEVMSMDFFGVPLATDPEIGGQSWGSLYMSSASDLREWDPYYAATPEAITTNPKSGKPVFSI
ncbi:MULTISPECIES: DNA polymerase [unclassified Streptomyces]|uniref:DNA polymerase n=1 Tax=unclassified Streptomyces TaxID=2593676 RepID=UPI0035E2975B